MDITRIDPTSVPDMGQEYWVQFARAGRCRPPSYLVRTAYVLIFGALSFALGWFEVWAVDSRSGWLVESGISSLAFIAAMLSGIAALAITVVTGEDALDQARWRRSMPVAPERYSPEIAETAYHLMRDVDLLNSLLEQRESLDAAIVQLHEKAVSGFESIKTYREAMAEPDIDVLTRHT